jgi:hypothetical protein
MTEGEVRRAVMAGVPQSVPGRCAAGCYLVVVGVLAGLAWHDPNAGFGHVELAALLLTLPALIVAIPFVYVIGAMAWNITNADSGGPMWPVTTCFVVMFVVVAAVNVLLAVRLAHRAATTSTSRSAT